jgi:hypothetical protein
MGHMTYVIFEPPSAQSRDSAEKISASNYKVFCVFRFLKFELFLKIQTLKSNFSQNRQTTVNSQIISFISFYFILYFLKVVLSSFYGILYFVWILRSSRCWLIFHSNRTVQQKNSNGLVLNWFVIDAGFLIFLFVVDFCFNSSHLIQNWFKQKQKTVLMSSLAPITLCNTRFWWSGTFRGNR